MLKKVLGAKGEHLAARFLERQGFEIVEQNFRYARGEIDIIARKENLVSFCEVKTRTSKTYGAGEDAVNSKKQEQIRKVADGYIVERMLDNCDFRFDVIVVEIGRNETKIRFIENAF